MSQKRTVDWLLRSHLRLRHLQLIMALSKEPSLSQAAERIKVAQPAASKLLSEIEAIFGQPLFERLPRGLAPTPQGEILIRNTAVMLRTLIQTAEELDAFSKGESGIVKIGTIMGPMIGFLLDIVEKTKRLYPNLHIVVEHDISDNLVKSLLDGGLDIVLARVPKGTDLGLFKYQSMFREELSFICREDHPLAKNDSVTTKDFLEWPWVVQPKGSALRHKFEQIFALDGFQSPRSVVDSTSTLFSLALASQSDTITALESSLAKWVETIGKFKVLSYKNKIFLDDCGVITVANRILTPGAMLMHENIKKAIVKLEG